MRAAQDQISEPLALLTTPVASLGGTALRGGSAATPGGAARLAGSGPAAKPVLATPPGDPDSFALRQLTEKGTSALASEHLKFGPPPSNFSLVLVGSCSGF